MPRRSEAKSIAVDLHFLLPFQKLLQRGGSGCLLQCYHTGTLILEQAAYHSRLGSPRTADRGRRRGTLPARPRTTRHARPLALRRCVAGRGPCPLAWTVPQEAKIEPCPDAMDAAQRGTGRKRGGNSPPSLLQLKRGFPSRSPARLRGLALPAQEGGSKGLAPWSRRRWEGHGPTSDRRGRLDVISYGSGLVWLCVDARLTFAQFASEGGPVGAHAQKRRPRGRR